MPPEFAYLLQALLTVLLFTIVAGTFLWVMRRMSPRVQTGPVRLVGRLVLDAKKSIILVQIGKEKVLVLGTTEHAIHKLDEISIELFLEANVAENHTPSQSFREVMAQVLRRTPKSDVKSIEENNTDSPHEKNTKKQAEE